MTFNFFHKFMNLLVPRCILIHLLSSCVASHTAPSEVSLSEKEVSAKVFYCSDGDTCHIGVNEGSVWFNVRLFGIDAPETEKQHANQSGQPLGDEAKNYLNTLVKGKDVTLIQADLDQYNRPVVEIFLEHKSVNLMLVEKGLAEMYRGRSKRIDRSKFEVAEAKAKTEKVGIWGLKTYESPSQFRKSRR